MCRKVNRHKVRIWGTENPKSVIEVARDSPKVNVFCAVSTFKVYGPFFFSEQTVTGAAFLDVLTEWLLPQLKEDSADFILRMDGAPPHFHRHVRKFLNQHLPQRWIGRGTDDDQILLAWPPRSADGAPCDFFLWGYVKEQVYVPPFPASISELKVRIRTAVELILLLQKCQISEAWKPAHTAMLCWVSGSNRQRSTYTVFSVSLTSN